LDAFGAELALIDRKFFPRLEANDAIIFNFELNAALHTAETAVRFYELVGFDRFPAGGRRVGQAWAEALDKLLVRNKRFCHLISAPMASLDSRPTVVFGTMGRCPGNAFLRRKLLCTGNRSPIGRARSSSRRHASATRSPRRSGGNGRAG